MSLRGRSRNHKVSARSAELVQWAPLFWNTQTRPSQVGTTTTLSDPVAKIGSGANAQLDSVVA
eukprot:2266747-Alexandrium_andersonii.AAC.1